MKSILRQGVKKLGSGLWIASVPLALTVLLAQPARAQHEGHDHAAPGHDHAEHAAPAPAGHDAAEAGAHHASPNPIKNFVDFGYSGKDDHGGVYEADKGDHKMPAPFLAALINFSILVFLLLRFAGPNIKKLVADRHLLIAKQLDESAKLRDEARAKLDEYSRKVSDLDAEIAKLVAGIRGEAEHEKRRIVAEAEARATRMKKDAEQQIEAEIGRVRAELEKEATLAALAVAEKLLSEKTTDADHRSLNERFIKELGGSGRPRA
jgi:F-type H+-transporting ATPase subunit b